MNVHTDKQLTGKTALVAGASGLVGRELLQFLLERPVYAEVHLLVRQLLPLTHPKLVQHVVDFDHLDRHRELFGVDDVFCCLGTTIKVAGSQAAFRRVDYEYPLALAQLAQAEGAQQFLLITAMGSDPQSKIFYNRTKGEVEQAIGALALPALHIFRPSLLLGDRQEFRLGERISAVLMKGLGFLFVGGLAKYKAIAGRTVAFAMYLAAQQRRTGSHVYESHRIAQLAQRGH